MPSLILANPNSTFANSGLQFIGRWLLGIKVFLRALHCTHPNRPAVTAGMTTCPHCQQQWRIQWQLATCTHCHRHVPPPPANLITAILQHHQTPPCPHCNSQQIAISKHWAISPYKAPYASIALLPISQRYTSTPLNPPWAINEVLVS